jgi:aldehyde dehydrogenase (NAD+)
VAARRIVFGKFYNAGQTCIAPDTLYVHRSRKGQMVREIGDVIERFYGSDPRQSSAYGRIVNDAHFSRLVALLDHSRVLIGGRSDRPSRYLSPTVVDGFDGSSPLATDEVFGPILPVVEYESPAELEEQLDRVPTPLALYVFTEDRRFVRVLRRRHPAGAFLHNDAFSHIMNPYLPFGGVGSSGLGSYHADESWRTFTRPAAILERSTRRDPSLRYPPYKQRAVQWVRRLLVR